MKPFPTALALACVLLLSACNGDKVTPSGTVQDCSAYAGIEKIVCLAENVKATLSVNQVETLQLVYTEANAKKWSNLPAAMSARNGIALSALNDDQLEAVAALIAAVSGTTADEGYDEIEQLRAADDYLNDHGGSNDYGAGNYYLAFLGTPSASDTWQILYTGHHMTFAMTFEGGQMTSATPAFRAAEPFATFTQDGKTCQPMQQERNALSAMLTSLSSNELASAKLSATFSDLLLKPGNDGAFPSVKSGLKAGNLTAAQKELIMTAIRTYVNDLTTDYADEILALYASEIDETYIAWSGNTGLSVRNDYARIDGPHVWIEYSVQNGIILSPTHPHSIWRDRSGDYGGNF